MFTGRVKEFEVKVNFHGEFGKKFRGYERDRSGVADVGRSGPHFLDSLNACDRIIRIGTVYDVPE
jgi:hypothetical protein